MDPESIVNATTETAKAANKFAEIIQRFKGPKWTRKQADADAYADEKKLQTIRDNPDMEIVYVDGKLNARERTPEALAFRAQQRQIAESVRQEQNIENVLQFAANEISMASDVPVSDAPVDDDWITRFFSITKDISSEEMQFIWGKILAGEIRQPGSFSMRTLDVLRNLSKSEAEVFQTITPFVLSAGKKGFVPSDETLLKAFGISYGLISTLDDCGLMNSGGLVSLNYTVTSSQTVSIHNSNYFISFSGLDEKISKVSLGIYGLTTAGFELFNILDVTTNIEYVFKYAESIFNDNNVNISIHKVNSIHNGLISYTKAAIKTFTK